MAKGFFEIEDWDPVDNSGEVSGLTAGTALATAGGYAATGAALGSFAPGIGNIIGGIVGTGIGLGGAVLAGHGNKYFTSEGNPGLAPGHKYVRYNSNRNHPVDHIMWDRDTGAIYYKDPKSGQYVKHTGIANTSFGYASDADLTKAADEIKSKLEIDALTAYLAEQSLALNTPTNTQISVPSPTSSDSILQQEYLKKKEEADKLLQNLLVPDLDEAEVTPDKDNTPYYNYGTSQFDLNYYIHNIGSNLQGYLESKNWSGAQKLAFLQAYELYKAALVEQATDGTGRLSTNDAGIIQDSANALMANSGTVYIDKEGNIYNSLDEIPSRKLRKSAKAFSPNKEVGLYLNIVGKAIVDAGKVKKTSEDLAGGEFDLNKNGFINYWVSKINPGGGSPDIDPYLALDPVNPEGKRERTNRTKYLIFELSKYLNKIGKSAYNFENTPFKSKEAYMTKIQQAIDNLSNGWDTTDPASLLAIGITPDFYTAFFSELANPLMTEQEIAAELAKNKAKVESDFIEKFKTTYDNFAAASHTYTENNGISYVKDSRYDPDILGAAQNIGVALRGLGFTINETDLIAVALTVDSLWEAVKAALRSGSTEVPTSLGTKSLQEILLILMPTFEKTFKESERAPGVKFYNDPAHDLLTGAILCIKNGKIYYDFIGNVKDCLAWQQLAAEFNSKYTISGDTPKYSFAKLGGILKKLLEGGTMDAETLEALLQIQQLQQTLSLEGEAEGGSVASPSAALTGTFSPTSAPTPGMALAKALYDPRAAMANAKGMSYSQYNLKQRSPNGLPDFYNGDSGQWKTEDYIRLGAIAADIVSLVLDPVSGAVTNVGSTGAHFMADWADDSVTATEMWKNLGMNLGMDALSIIPIVGDAAGTGGKLVKSVKAIAPKLLYGLTAWGVLGTLKNGANIMESFQKVMSDEKLTVGDWQNIAQAITAVAGVNGAVKSGVAKRMAKKNAKQEDAIGLGLRQQQADGTLGASLDYIFRGEHAKELRKLINEGEVDKVNAKIQELEGFHDFVVNENLASNPVELHSPLHRVKGEDGKSSWKTQDVFSTKKVIDAFDIYNPDLLRGGYASRNLLNTNRQDAVETGNIFEPKSKAEVDAMVDALIRQDASEAVAATEARKLRIQENQEAIDNARVKVKDASGKDVSLTEAEAQVELARRKDSLAKKLRDYEEIITNNRDLSSRKIGNRTYELTVGADGKAIVKKLKSLEKDIVKLETSCTKLKSDLDAAKTELAEFETLVKESGGKSAISARDAAHLDSLLKKVKAAEKALTKERAALTARKGDLKEIEEWKKGYKQFEELDLALDHTLVGSEAQLAMAFEDSIHKFDNRLATLRRRLEILAGNQDKGIAPTRTNKTEQLYTNLLSQPYRIEYAPGRFREVLNVREILDGFNLLRQGGRLLFLRLAGKFDGGGKSILYAKLVEDPNFDFFPTWINEIGRNQERLTNIQNWMDTILDADALIQAVKNNAEWHSEGNHTWSNSKDSYYSSDNIGRLQSQYNEATKNAAINLAKVNGRYNKTNMNNNEPSDGRFSAVTNDRMFFGYADDPNNWNPNKDGAYTAFNNYLGSRDLMFVQSGPQSNGHTYWVIGKKEPTEDSSLTTPPLSEGKDGGPTITDGDTSGKGSTGGLSFYDDDSDVHLPEKSAFATRKTLSKAFGPAMETFRWGLLANANAKNADEAIANRATFLLKPKTSDVLVHSDLGKEALGQEEYGRTMRVGETAVSSDADKQLAFKKQLHMTGAAALDAKMEESSDTYRKTQAADQALRDTNKTNEINTANQNTLEMTKTLMDQEKIRSAAKTDAATQLDNLLSTILYSALTDMQDSLDKMDSRVLSELSKAIAAHPDEYDTGLTAAELEIYQKVQRGDITDSSKLNRAETLLLQTANDKIAAASTRAYYDYLGIPENEWTRRAYNFDYDLRYRVTLSELTGQEDKLREEINALQKKEELTSEEQQELENKLKLHNSLMLNILAMPNYSLLTTLPLEAFLLSLPPQGQSRKLGGTLHMAKDGTKLEIAKIRNRAKNADRFLKNIEHKLNSLDKKIDRIARSMYGLPKSEIVKLK